MSLLKIGSVTDAVGENGTRWIHRRTVSQAPDIEPPMRIAMNRATAPSAQPASGVRSGMSPASKTIALAGRSSPRGS